MAIGILKKEGHNVTFMQYVKIGAIVVLVQLSLATAYLFGAEKIGLIKKLDPKAAPLVAHGADTNGTQGHGSDGH